MKLIITQEVAGLGSPGDVIAVKNSREMALLPYTSTAR